MSKKSKKRKRKKSSSSSEEDSKSKEQDVAKNYKSGRRNHDVKERYIPTVKDVSQSTRQIKTPVYRLSKTQVTGQKPVDKEERTKSKSGVVPLHREKCSSRAKHDISGNDNSVSGSKTVERGPSTPSNDAGTAPQRTEKTSKGSLDETSSQSSSSKLKKQRMSPSVVSAEQKQDRLKRKCRAEEPPRTGNDSNAVKTREPSRTSSVSKESSWQKRTELFEKICQRQQENKAKSSPCREAKTHSASTTKQRSPFREAKTHSASTTKQRSPCREAKTHSASTTKQRSLFKEAKTHSVSTTHSASTTKRRSPFREAKTHSASTTKRRSPFREAKTHSASTKKQRSPCREAKTHSASTTKQRSPFREVKTHSASTTEQGSPFREAKTHSASTTKQRSPCREAKTHSASTTKQRSPFREAKTHSASTTEQGSPFREAKTHSASTTKQRSPFREAKTHSASTTEQGSPFREAKFPSVSTAKQRSPCREAKTHFASTTHPASTTHSASTTEQGSPFREAKFHSVSATKHFSTSANQAVSVSSSKLVKNVTTIPGKFTSVPHKTVKASSAQQQIFPFASPLPIKFKIAKKVQPRPGFKATFLEVTPSFSSEEQDKRSSLSDQLPATSHSVAELWYDQVKNSKRVQPRPVYSPGENNYVRSTDRNLKHGTELSDSGASRSNSKQETVQQAPTFLDVTPSFSSEEQEKRSSLSDQLPATSHSVTEPWYDQVINSKRVQPRPVYSPGENNDVRSRDRNLKHGTELSDSGASRSNSKQETVQQAPTFLDVTPSFSSEEQDKRSSLSDQLPDTSHSVTEPWYDQMTVVEELHLARSEKRLEMNVMQSYGELTCMDTDPPEGAADTHCQQPPQQDLIIVLDTNILLSHLGYVRQIQCHGLVLIPWVVLQELDSLKSRRGMPGSVAHLAIPAISYIYNCLKNREPNLRGQSGQQAAESIDGLNAENNDDRVLQCCLQYQSLYPECALILCTDDKNLCCKALMSGVTALSKSDLEAEIGRSKHGFHPPQNIKPPMLPHIGPLVSLPMQSRCAAVQPHCQERTGFFVEEKDNKRLSTVEDEEETKWNNSSVCELEVCLRDVLSDVLEVEMKAAYDELWLEIVYVKPPWTLRDVLQCLKKHWVAVFGQIVPRWMEQTVLKLIDFFNSGKTADYSAASAAFQEAKELVEAFRKSSTLVPSAISIMNNLYNKLHPQWESPAGDVVMNDKDEDKQPTSAQVSHQEVWAVFENIWSYVFQLSLEVFNALGFDPHNMRSAQPVGGPPPPQGALDCLHRLSSMVSQLLQSFSSVLSSPPGLEEVQTLLGIIHSNKVVDEDSRVTAKDFLDCFSQQEYREKLRLGGNQLMELKEALDRCVSTMGQHITFTTLPC